MERKVQFTSDLLLMNLEIMSAFELRKLFYSQSEGMNPFNVLFPSTFS